MENQKKEYSQQINIKEINTFYTRNGSIYLNIQDELDENYNLTFESYEFLQFFDKDTLADIKKDLVNKVSNL